ARVLGQDLQRRRRDLLRQLRTIRGPEQRDARARRGAAVDRANHDLGGIVSSAMMFVRGPVSFYTLRFLLGAAEAGFFPGIIFYLTRWFPARERARTMATFMTAILVAGVVGSPVSGALLSLSAGGLAGWQWL